MKIETKLTHLGLSEKETGGVVSIPPFRASTIIFKNFADFEAGERGEAPMPTYGRYGTPSTVAFEATMAELDGGDHAIACASGMAAIAVALFAFVKPGDHVLMVDTAYGPTRRFCDQVLKRMNIEVTYYAPTIGAGIAALIQDNTKVVYCESPGSLTFEMQDVPAIAAEAHKRGAIVIADNTWATPLNFRPFEKGVDISMHSATKYISGHSDLVMGLLTCKKEHYKQLLYTFRNFGASPSGDNCFLAMRGLRSMAVRVKQQEQNAIAVAKWLQKHPAVASVHFPALPEDPGHALWKRDMQGATSLFGVELKAATTKQLEVMLDGLKYFGMGFSWGGFESLIIPCHLEKLRSAEKWKGGPMLRLHIGLEAAEDLIADLDAGFARLAKA